MNILHLFSKHFSTYRPKSGYVKETFMVARVFMLYMNAIHEDPIAAVFYILCNILQSQHFLKIEGWFKSSLHVYHRPVVTKSCPSALHVCDTSCINRFDGNLSPCKVCILNRERMLTQLTMDMLIKFIL